MLVEYQLEDTTKEWSNESFRANFNDAYTGLHENDCQSRVGIAIVAPKLCKNSRFLHWEIFGGSICLRDSSTRITLLNSAVCVRLGASDILEVHVESFERSSAITTAGETEDPLNASISVRVSFLQQDGNIHALELFSHNTSVSVLDHLVLSREGRLVNLTGTLSVCIPGVGVSGARSQQQQQAHWLGGGSGGEKDSAAVAVAGSTTGMSLRSAVVESLPANRDILCAAWVSPSVVLLGLSDGDSMLVTVKMTDSTGTGTAGTGAGGIASGACATEETLLRDRGDLQLMLSGLIELGGGKVLRGVECDSIVAASIPSAHSAAAPVLVINRSGEMRVWSAVHRVLMTQTSLFDVVNAVPGAVPELQTLLPASSSVDQQQRQKLNERSIHLQDCIARMTLDGTPSGNRSSRNILAAVAVVLADENSSVAVEFPPPKHMLYASQGLTHDKLPIYQQTWKIFLLGWKDLSSSAVRANNSEKPKLIAAPITFPFDSAQAAQEAGLTFRSASLVDLQLQVDEAKDVVRIVSVWRATAVATGSIANDGVEELSVEEDGAGQKTAAAEHVFESIVGKVEFSLRKLRSQLESRTAVDDLRQQTSATSTAALDTLVKPLRNDTAFNANSSSSISSRSSRSTSSSSSHCCAVQLTLQGPSMERVLRRRYDAVVVARQLTAARAVLSSLDAEKATAAAGVTGGGALFARTVDATPVFAAFKAIMIQRIFLPRRYTDRAIVEAFVVFWHKQLGIAGRQMAEESKSTLSGSPLFARYDDGSNTGGTHSDAEKVSVARYLRGDLHPAQLPSLVLRVCTLAAESAHHISYSDRGGALSYLKCLHESFSLFIQECDRANTRLERVHVGALANAATTDSVWQGTFALVAHIGGAVGIIDDTSILSMPLSPAAGTKSSQKKQQVQVQTLLGLMERSLFPPSTGSDNAHTAHLHASTSFLELDRIIEDYIAEGGKSSDKKEFISGITQWFAAIVVTHRDSLMPDISDTLESLLYASSNRSSSSVGGSRFPHSFVDCLLNGASTWDASSTTASRVENEKQPDSTISAGSSSSSSSSNVSGFLELLRINIRQRIQHCKIVIALLVLISDATLFGSPAAATAVMDDDVYNYFRDYAIPKAIGKLMHMLLIQWLDSVRPTKSPRTRADTNYRDVDLTDLLMPLGMKNGIHTFSIADNAVDESASVLENFVSDFCHRSNFSGRMGGSLECGVVSGSGWMQQLWNRLLGAVCVDSYPSVRGELPQHLAHTGQYVALDRWLLVAKWNATCTTEAVVSFLPEIESAFTVVPPVEKLLISLGLYSITATRLTAEYFEMLRQLRMRQKHTTMVHGMNAAVAQLIAAIRVKIGEILSTINASIQALRDEVSDPTTTCALSAEPGDDVAPTAAGGLLLSMSSIRDSTSEYIADLQSQLEARMLDPRLQRCSLRREYLQLQQEGLLLLRDAFSKMTADAAVVDIDVSTLGALLRTTVLTIGATGDIQGDSRGVAAVKHICESKTADLCIVLSIEMISGASDLIERSGTLLPVNVAAELAMDASRLLVEQYEAALDPLSELAPSILPRTLLLGLRGAWTRVFENSLRRGDCGDGYNANSVSCYPLALNALLHLADLEEQHILPSSTTTTTTAGVGGGGGGGTEVSPTTATRLVPWRDCLRALVIQACKNGKLGWLCSVPDRTISSLTGNSSSGKHRSSNHQKIGSGTSSLSLSAAIASTLEVLIASLDVDLSFGLSSTGSSGDGFNVNFTECLFVYLISRRQYREAARVMRTWCSRLDTDGRELISGTSSSVLLTITDHQTNSLAAGLTALKVLPVEQRYILHRDEAHGDDISGVGPIINGRDMQCTNEKVLSLLFAHKKSVRVIMLETAVSNVPHPADAMSMSRVANSQQMNAFAATQSMDALVIALCNSGNVMDALTLAACCSDCAKHSALQTSGESALAVLIGGNAESLFPLLDIPLVSLVSDCVLASAFATATGTSIISPEDRSLRMAQLVQELTLRCPLLSTVAATTAAGSTSCTNSSMEYQYHQTLLPASTCTGSSGSSGTDIGEGDSFLWGQLIKLVRSLDEGSSSSSSSSSGGGGLSVHAHRVAVRAALNSSRRRTSRFSRANYLFVPMPLLDSFAERDIGALLRLLLEYGDGGVERDAYGDGGVDPYYVLGIACHYALREVERANEGHRRTPAIFPPYSALDQLLEACQRVDVNKWQAEGDPCDSGGGSHRLSFHYASLQRALQEHFLLLLHAEI